MNVTRLPTAELRPLIQILWASTPDEPSESNGPDFERMLPTGSTHLVFRLSGGPIRILDRHQGHHALQGHAMIGGVRAQPYYKHLRTSGDTVGVLLHPGACRALLGSTTSALAGGHHLLEDLWGPSANHLCEQLQSLVDPHQRLDLLEHHLIARFRRSAALLRPDVAHALTVLERGRSIRSVAESVNLSHRHFISLFREEVGMSPKLHLRLRRFQGVLEKLYQSPSESLAEIAFDCGYSDQAHMTREFREFAEMSPGDYRRRPIVSSHHVPMSPGEEISP